MSSMLHITPKVSVYIYIYLYICVDIHGTSSIFKASGFDMAQLMLLGPLCVCPRVLSFPCFFERTEDP